MTLDRLGRLWYNRKIGRWRPKLWRFYEGEFFSWSSRFFMV